jgi:hypothetical protein
MQMAEPERSGDLREDARGDGLAAQDRVRALIRAEIARHDPTDDARGPLALIAETSVRSTLRGGTPVVSVVDAQGRPRMRMEDGQPVDFTLSDLVAELRQRHPALFKRRRPALDPAPPRPADPPHGTVNETGAMPGPSPAPISLPEPGGRDGSSNIRVSYRRIARFPVRMVMRFAERVRDGAEPAPVIDSDPLPAAPPERRSEPLVRAKTLLADIRDGAPRRWRLIGATAGLVALLGVGAFQVRERFMGGSDKDETIAMGEAPRSEPSATGAVAEPPAGTGPATLRGAAEAIDTATLRMQGRIVRLFGVEWAKGGGKPEDLTTYLNGREIVCEPASGADVYHCQVGGQDLSKVVLFNGGGRTTAQATQELKAAEDNARAAKVGVWSE